jgi:peptide deformylase
LRAGEAVIAIRPILTYGAPLLRRKAQPVTEPLDGLRSLVDDMFETMYAEPGIGLAANQIGVSKRVAVIAEVADDDEGRNVGPRLVLVNPEIHWFSDDLVPFEEGCLSVPDITEVVERPRAIRFRCTDLEGKRVDREAAGLLARVVQHEVDHLNGILFVDRLSLIKKQLLRKRLRQLATASRA